MAERLNARDSKSCLLAIVTGVQIPPHPPIQAQNFLGFFVVEEGEPQGSFNSTKFYFAEVSAHKIKLSLLLQTKTTRALVVFA